MPTRLQILQLILGSHIHDFTDCELNSMQHDIDAFLVESNAVSFKEGYDKGFIQGVSDASKNVLAQIGGAIYAKNARHTFPR